jgi:diacylglycerol kinase (ATP)
MATKNAVIILNPASGGGVDDSKIKIIKDKAIELGWVGDFVLTTKDKDAGKIAEEHISRGITHIVICGGDGSVREVTKVLVNKNVTLGIIPVGTGNIYAKILGIPINIEDAVFVAFYGKEKKVDVGKANDSFFNLVAGVGIDVNTMRQTSKTMKSKFGIVSYFWNGLKELYKHSKRYRVILDDKQTYVYKATSILVANIGKTTAGIKIAPDAGPTSGDLNVGILQANTLFSWINIAVDAIRGNLDRSPHYQILEAKHVVIYPLKGSVAYECDGDVFQPTDKLDVTIYPKSVTVLTK